MHLFLFVDNKKSGCNRERKEYNINKYFKTIFMCECCVTPMCMHKLNKKIE